MPAYVKIIITDEEGKTLELFYLRDKKWGIPAGLIEEKETPRRAAVRELLERTGYEIEGSKLIEDCSDGEFLIFRGKSEDLVARTYPGATGGYKTKTRWH